MVSLVDVTGREPTDARAAIVDALADAEPDDEVTITADQDPDAALCQAQIGHDRVLTWGDEPTETSDPDTHTVRVRVSEDVASDPVAFDVRGLPPQKRHSVLTETFEKLDPGRGFVLVNDHDPKPLYHELRSTHGDVVGWEYHDRGGDDWRVRIQKTGVSGADDDAVTASFDVREIPKKERHPTIHHRYSNLTEGDVMEIIAPHEPRPLHQEFRQQYGDAFQWEIKDTEPGRCRVWITKETAEDTADGRDVTAQSTGHGCGHDHGSTADPAAGHGCGHAHGDTADPDPEHVTEELTVIEELDVREHPPAKRHELIFEAYADLAVSEGFVLVNDHDPKPLYHQFDAEAGPEFRWEYQQQDPGEFRVLIGKADVEASERTATTGFDAPF